jgi:hypothetical protein
MSTLLTAEQRTLRARLAAQSRWAKSDPQTGTAAARAAFLARFENEVDPDRKLPVAERARRAESARRAHMTRLALASSKARRTRSAVKAAR